MSNEEATVPEAAPAAGGETQVAPTPERKVPPAGSPERGSIRV